MRNLGVSSRLLTNTIAYTMKVVRAATASDVVTAVIDLFKWFYSSGLLKSILECFKMYVFERKIQRNT